MVVGIPKVLLVILWTCGGFGTPGSIVSQPAELADPSDSAVRLNLESVTLSSFGHLAIDLGLGGISVL